MKLVRQSYTDVVKQFRLLDKGESEGLRIALGGNANLEFMLPGLVCKLHELGYQSNPNLLEYDSWIQAILSNDISCDFWVIWISSIAASKGGTSRQNVDVKEIAEAAKVLVERREHLIFILPEPMSGEIDPFSAESQWRREQNEKLRETLPSAVTVVSLDHIQRFMGALNWYAPRYWTLAKSPAHPNAMTQTGDFVATLISQTLRPQIKAIITDLDNTLWDGVVGDDGVENIGLDINGQSRAFVEMQLFLKDQIETGVPLCVCSKNTIEQAQKPFTDRSEMVLTLDDFVYFEASWQPKYKSIQAIAERLNVGLEAICFIDDSPHEREETRTFLPKLCIPDIPSDAEERVQFLRETGWFIRPKLLDEDTNRVKTYNENVKRHNAKKDSTSLEGYLKALKINVTVEPIGQSSVARAVQLIQKTNQFNLSGKRYTPVQLNSFASLPGNYAFTFKVSDRFGDSGIVSVALGYVSDTSMMIDTWVLSCRVFSRTIEHAILAHMLEWAKTNELKDVQLLFQQTKRNNIVKSFLSEIGFLIKDEGKATTFVCALDANLEHYAEILNEKNKNRK